MLVSGENGHTSPLRAPCAPDRGSCPGHSGEVAWCGSRIRPLLRHVSDNCRLSGPGMAIALGTINRRANPRGAIEAMTTTLRIAVADDEPEMREFFARLLPRLGHQVVAVAENGGQLVEQCRQVRPDLIITDVTMPGLDGIDACTQISQEYQVPVILVSAYHDPALIQRAEAIHVMAYLVKPIGLADLQPVIAIAMRRFQELQALHKDRAIVASP